MSSVSHPPRPPLHSSACIRTLILVVLSNPLSRQPLLRAFWLCGLLSWSSKPRNAQCRRGRGGGSQTVWTTRGSKSLPRTPSSWLMAARPMPPPCHLEDVGLVGLPGTPSPCWQGRRGPVCSRYSPPSPTGGLGLSAGTEQGELLPRQGLC